MSINIDTEQKSEVVETIENEKSQLQTSDKVITSSSSNNNPTDNHIGIIELSADNNYSPEFKYKISISDLEVGFISADGSIIQKDNKYFKGHYIGRIKDNYQREAVVFYIQKFDELRQKYDKLYEEYNSTLMKPNLLDKIQELIEFIPVSTAMGDFEKLIDQVEELKINVNEKFQKNLEEKTGLCEQAEMLSESSAWKETTDEIKKLQERWKEIGPVQSEQSEIIWKRFRSAIDKFFERLRLNYEELEKERTENLKKKESLCEKAEALVDSNEWKKTNDEMKKLQEEWKQIGPAPILQSDHVWNRFRAALDKFYERLRVHYNELDKDRSENLKKKEELCLKAESLIDSTAWRKTANEFKKLQEEWKQIGPAPIEYSDAVWKRFKTAVDGFYEKLRKHLGEVDSERKANYEKKEQLCLQAEALCKSTNWNETAEALKNLQQEWKTIGPAPDDLSEEIWNRFRKSMDIFFERRREFFVQKSKAVKEKSETWKTRLKESLFRKNEQLARLKELIKLDEQNISKLQEKIAEIGIDNNTETRKTLENKITDVQAGLNSKLEKLKEYEETIKEIDSKLKI